MKNNLAKNSILTINIVFSIFIVSCLPPALAQSKSPKPCKEFVLYYQDFLYNGTNREYATSASVTNDSALSPGTHFGKTVIFDDPVAKDGRRNSEPVGRAQGFYFYNGNGNNNFNAWFAFTLVFNSTEQHGTLNIMGADIISAKTRDFSVVGGTGDFFLTRGICTVSTDELDGDFYFRLKLDIKLYECYTN